MNEPIENSRNSPGGNGPPKIDETVVPMSHQEAAASNAVELYVLRGLTAEQELRFEAHYFECRACAQAVSEGQILARKMRSQLEPWWRRFAGPVLAPVTALLLALVGYENVYTIPALKADLARVNEPQPNTVIVAHQEQLGQDEGESVKTESITVELNLPSEAGAPFYLVQISSQGKLPLNQVVPAPENPRLSLHLTRQSLGRGPSNVLIYGLHSAQQKAGPQIGQYHFNIQ